MTKHIPSYRPPHSEDPGTTLSTQEFDELLARLVEARSFPAGSGRPAAADIEVTEDIESDKATGVIKGAEWL